MLIALAAVNCATSPLSVPQTSDSKEDKKDHKGPLLWIDDDYDSALALAKETNKPLVIDIWAPWCHTCLSMKHYVLNDPSMVTFSSRFVWLALDTDKPSSATVLEKLPVQAWPTFFVLSPGDESVQARYQGAASLAQFREFLTQGEQGHLDASVKEEALKSDDPLFLVRKGDRAALSGDLAAADAAYGAAIQSAPIDWPRRPDVLVSRIGVRAAGECWSDCADLGLEFIDRTGSSASATDFIYYASWCASMLEKSDPRRTNLYERAVKRLTEITDSQSSPLAVDDRSDALKVLRQAYLALDNEEAAVATAKAQLALLDDAVRDAPNPKAASTYNWPRAEVYVYLDRGDELIEALRASHQALPNDYDPPYRLAWVALQIGKLDLALEAANRTLDLVYGPRKGRVLNLVADIHKARGDSARHRAALEAAVDLYESLPEGQKQPKALEHIQKALKEIK